MWQLILGPILGIVGSTIEKVTEYKTKQLEIKERALERDHDLAVMSKEADIAVNRITIEGEIAVGKIDAQTFQSSYKLNSDPLLPDDTKLSQRQVSWVLFVELFCRVIRPASTTMYQIFLAVIFGWAAWNVGKTGSTFFSGEEFKVMFREMVYSVIGIAETTLFWWYGIRRMSKKKDS